MTMKQEAQVLARPCVFTRISRVAPYIAAVAITALGLVFLSGKPAKAAGDDGIEYKSVDWSFQPPFGTYDRSQIRRGYKVYKEVCAACHAMELVKFRNLEEPGGPEFSEAQVKALAAEYEIEDGPDDMGDMFMRPREPKDSFPAPFPNANAARAANNGAYPVDLSVIVKARSGGADYIYSLLTGYYDTPQGFPLSDGMSYNAYFSGAQIAMMNPLMDDIVEYEDGTPMTADQYAKDVTAFLMWAAEPKLEARHRMGFQVIIFLTVLAGLLFFAGRKLWADKH